MKIYVKDLVGETIELEADAWDEIDSLKDQLFFKTGISPNQQRLIFAGKQLEEGPYRNEARERRRVKELKIAAETAGSGCEGKPL